MLSAERWLQCDRALAAAGDSAYATEVLARGRAWLLTTAAEEVPGPFRESFPQRSHGNRELITLAPGHTP